MKPLFITLLMVMPMFASKELDEYNKRVRESTAVLSEIMHAGDKSIPEDLLRKAECVGIVPGLKRVGFIVGGQYGKGVLTCRLPNTIGWSALSTIRIEGGSIGLQIGAGETDVVFVVMDQRGMEKLSRDKFTVGGDASVMAGPVGRTADAQTDAMLHAEILAWSRARGVFAGVSLDGATLRPDNDDNDKVYHRRISQKEILHGDVNAPPDTMGLYDELNKYAPFRKTENVKP